jgi:lipopolysaccharide export LptBFGC system permease protein LptF
MFMGYSYLSEENFKIFIFGIIVLVPLFIIGIFLQRYRDIAKGNVTLIVMTC